MLVLVIIESNITYLMNKPGKCNVGTAILLILPLRHKYLSSKCIWHTRRYLNMCAISSSKISPPIECNQVLNRNLSFSGFGNPWRTMCMPETNYAIIDLYFYYQFPLVIGNSIKNIRIIKNKFDWKRKMEHINSVSKHKSNFELRSIQSSRFKIWLLKCDIVTYLCCPCTQERSSAYPMTWFLK